VPDVFISYSRKDKEFVRRLHDSLAQDKRDVWVDWEDIPFASDWRAEIFAGIESANAFLIIISPDSVASPVVAEEISHALECEKRLIPILYREGDYANINQAISSHNWIYFRDSDDYHSAFKSLLNTIDTDLSYVRDHTRLLIRAKEWETKDRNASFYLRGDDLRDAEIWLATSVNKVPAPTGLHLEYIAASRQANSARQRATIAALSIGFIVAIVLALFALNQSRLAQDNAATAVANFQLSERLRLAAESNAAIRANGGNGELAALLTIRALKDVYSPQADAALVRPSIIYMSSKPIADILTKF
jgi:hypothetical protein